jgi:uncharacterized protein (DUF2062 family)
MKVWMEVEAFHKYQQAYTNAPQLTCRAKRHRLRAAAASPGGLAVGVDVGDADGAQVVCAVFLALVGHLLGRGAAE